MTEKHEPWRFLVGRPLWPVIVICPCGQWHRAPLRSTEEFHLRLECGLHAHLTFEQPGPFIQFYWKGGVIGIEDLGGGAEQLYIKLEER